MEECCCQGGCREFEPRLPLIKKDWIFPILFNLMDDIGEELILVRTTCEQRAKALSLSQAKLVKRKSVDLFNVSRSRQPRLPLIKKAHLMVGLFN